MRLLLLCALLAAAAASMSCTADDTDRKQLPQQQSHSAGELTDTWAVKLKPGADPEAIATKYNMTFIGKVGSLEGIFQFKQLSENNSRINEQLSSDPMVIWAERQVLQQMQRKPE